MNASGAKKVTTMHVSGYRPIVTRRIGFGPKSTVVPAGFRQGVGREQPQEVESHQPPEHGFSAWHAYDDVEVLLEDHSATCADDCYALPPPEPLGASPVALHVDFSPAGALTLEQPTRLEAHGQSYDFDGFYLFTNHELHMPQVRRAPSASPRDTPSPLLLERRPALGARALMHRGVPPPPPLLPQLQLVSGEGVVTVRLTPVDFPDVLLLEAERAALCELHSAQPLPPPRTNTACRTPGPREGAPRP